MNEMIEDLMGALSYACDEISIWKTCGIEKCCANHGSCHCRVSEWRKLVKRVGERIRVEHPMTVAELRPALGQSRSQSETRGT